MLLSAFGFAAMAVCVKLVFARGIPVLEIVAARASVSLVLSYLDIRRKGLSAFGTHKVLLASRGIVGALALIAVYTAVTRLPLAEATMLQYLHPMFVALLAVVFLGEKLRLSVLVCVFLSLIGVLLVTDPSILFSHFHEGSTSNLDTFGIVMALLGAFGSAIAYVLVRKLGSLEDSSVIILYFPLIALPLSLLLLGDEFVWPSQWSTWLLLGLVGIFTQVGQVGLTKAMQTETAARATAASYVQVVFAVVFGMLFFAEFPSMSAMVGLGFIVVGAMINVFSKPAHGAELGTAQK